MKNQENTTPEQTLGQILREAREKCGFSLDDIVTETKISHKILVAMENDDFQALPADVFARGLYILYAKALQLDQEGIVRKYSALRSEQALPQRRRPPEAKGETINDMAARPSRGRIAAIGFSLVVVLAMATAFSWYFNWNPASFISSKLKGLQTAPQDQSEPQSTGGDPALISRETGGDGNQETAFNYSLTLHFQEDAHISIGVDGAPLEQGKYAKGSSRSWYAQDSIQLLLPPSVAVKATLNGEEFPIPQKNEGPTTLLIP